MRRKLNGGNRKPNALGTDEKILEVVLQLRDEFSGELGGVVKKTQSSAAKMQAVGRQLTGVGRSLTMGLTLPIVGVGVAAVKMSTDFNASMANIATLIPGSTERVIELKHEIQDMAIEIGKGTDDLSSGLYQVISAYGDTSDSIKILKINAKAATAGLATTAQAIDLTSAVTKGYGDTSAAAVQQASDLAFQTVKLGQTTFPELAGSIGRVVPLAATLGVEVEELFAGFATLTGVTGGATEVSTQFAAIQRAMIKPTESMTKAIADLKFESAEAMIADLGLVGSLEALIETTDGSQESVAALFGRAEALTAVFALTGAQADEFKRKLKAMAVAAGVADDAFDEVTGGVNAAGHEFNILKQEAIVLMQNLGDDLAPALREVLEALKPLLESVKDSVKWFGEQDEATQKVILGFFAFMALLGPLLIFVGNVVAAIGSIGAAIGVGAAGTGVAGAITGLGATSVAVFGAPAGVIVLAIAGTIGALAMLINKANSVATAFEDLSGTYTIEIKEVHKYYREKPVGTVEVFPKGQKPPSLKTEAELIESGVIDAPTWPAGTVWDPSKPIKAAEAPPFGYPEFSGLQPDVGVAGSMAGSGREWPGVVSGEGAPLAEALAEASRRGEAFDFLTKDAEEQNALRELKQQSEDLLDVRSKQKEFIEWFIGEGRKLGITFEEMDVVLEPLMDPVTNVTEGLEELAEATSNAVDVIDAKIADYRNDFKSRMSGWFKDKYSTVQFGQQIGQAVLSGDMGNLVGGLAGEFTSEALQSTTGGIIGAAIEDLGWAGGPVIGMVSTLVGGLVGKLFGKKSDRGESRQNPVWTRGVNDEALLTAMTNAAQAMRMMSAARGRNERTEAREFGREIILVGAG